MVNRLGFLVFTQVARVRMTKRIIFSFSLHGSNKCVPNSIKVALGIGDCALGSYCLAVTHAKHCIVFVCPNAQCPIANDQLPKQEKAYYLCANGYKLAKKSHFVLRLKEGK